jgi:hypothetical protein
MFQTVVRTDIISPNSISRLGDVMEMQCLSVQQKLHFEGVRNKKITKGHL